MSIQYKNPPTTKSGIDGDGSNQMNTYLYHRQAVIAAKDEIYFGALSSTIDMPKHMGKEIRVYEYVPLLDDRNVNDQGINAAGVTIANGNLYGSSRDVGTITSALPVLNENGGRVNRVGFKRITLKGSLVKMGFFFEFTEDSLNFDSDADLYKHLSREAVNGATKINEDLLQKDLLAAAGVIVYAGAATNDGEVTGSTAGVPSEVNYDDLVRLARTLTDNKTPKQTKVISGSQLTDTRTIPSARVLFAGPELEKTFRSMKDYHNDPAFIPVEKYADKANLLNGEIGAIDQFRIVINPDMMHWVGVGADSSSDNDGTYLDDIATSNYNVYPVLCVGSESFVTIGFQSSGGDNKFNITTRKPGKEVADRNDPYGSTGFCSIQWYYGFLAKRPERIGLIKTVARA